MANDWLAVAWTQVWQVTILIIAVWLLTRLAMARRPQLAFLLWMVVIVKCVTPPIWSSQSGAFCWLRSPTDGGRCSTEMTDPAMPHVLAARVYSDAAVKPNAAAPILVVDAPPRWTFAVLSWPAWIAVIWISGVVVALAATGRRWRRSMKLFRTVSGRGESAYEMVAASLSRRLGIRRRVRLAVTDEPAGPAAMGLFRPAVLLPRTVIGGKSADDIEMILAHELIHIRRGDSWFGLLRLLATSLWWFHPLVWWASRQASRAAERCCDEAVLAELKCNPARYARCLLDVLDRTRVAFPVPACPGVSGMDVTKERLERIMKIGDRGYRRTPWWCWGAAILAAAVVLPGAARSVSDGGKGSDDKPVALLARSEVPPKAKPLPPPPPPSFVTQASQEEERAVSEIRKFGGEVTIDEKDPRRPATCVAFHYTEVPDAILEHVKRLTKLHALMLVGTDVTDARFPALKGLVQLQDLDLSYATITDAGLECVKGLTNLRSLNLRETEITDAGLEHLKGLTKLQYLVLVRTKVTDAGLEHLKGMTGLRYLYLDETKVTDAGLVCLAKRHPQLQYLDLCDTKVTDAGLQHVKELTQLQVLQLSDTKVTDAGLQHVKGLTQLQSLDLNDTKVTDAGLECLAGLAELQCLELRGTKVTDAGLRHLKWLHKLQGLELGGTLVSEDGVKKLYEWLPKCAVLKSDDQRGAPWPLPPASVSPDILAGIGGGVAPSAKPTPVAVKLAYPVEDILSRIQEEQKANMAESKAFLDRLLKEKDLQFDWSADNRQLLVTAAASGQTRVTDTLELMRKNGTTLLTAIKVYFVTRPVEKIRQIGWTALPSDLPASADMFGLVDVRFDTSDEPSPNQSQKVVERVSPLLYKIMDKRAEQKLIAQWQADDKKTNILQFPTDTVFSGQTVDMSDCAHQVPFVIGVKNGQPQTRMISEGTTILIRPIIKPSGGWRVQFIISVTGVRKVDKSQLPAVSKDNPIAIQVPEVGTDRMQGELALPWNASVMLCGTMLPELVSGGNALCLVVHIEKVPAK
jgi:beta-lactamase regulating signal transducer with metallopeptidase domain